jgi:DSHCT (NUC185) domain
MDCGKEDCGEDPEAAVVRAFDAPGALSRSPGRVACEIQSADELVLTELIFDGIFNEMTPEAIVALLSVFVWSEKSDVGVKVREDLEAPFAVVAVAARRVGRVAVDSKLALDVEDYVASFRPDLMEAMVAWYRGTRFADVYKMNDIYEASSSPCEYDAGTEMQSGRQGTQGLHKNRGSLHQPCHSSIGRQKICGLSRVPFAVVWCRETEICCIVVRARW